jgi:hypothetical protein
MSIKNIFMLGTHAKDIIQKRYAQFSLLLHDGSFNLEAKRLHKNITIDCVDHIYNFQKSCFAGRACGEKLPTALKSN